LIFFANFIRVISTAFSVIAKPMTTYPPEPFRLLVAKTYI